MTLLTLGTTKFGARAHRRVDFPQRLRAALLHAGSSVLCGAGSTMCGFVALAFAQTHTFQVFFRMTFATVALALLHALLVFPALLAWFGPSEKEE
mgnify:CR=1 FL=1